MFVMFANVDHKTLYVLTTDVYIHAYTYDFKLSVFARAILVYLQTCLSSSLDKGIRITVK